MARIKGALVYKSAINDNIFDERHFSNRDDSNIPFIMLKKEFLRRDIELHTPDYYHSKKVIDFEIHLNVQNNINKVSKKFLLLLETELIYPKNKNPNTTLYEKIFSWDDTKVMGNKFVKINFPNMFKISPADGYQHRDIFCSMIAGNKASAIRDERVLYSERIKTIKWFEKNAPLDFKLYGTGWDSPAKKNSTFERMLNKLCGIVYPVLGIRPFKTYGGKIENKMAVLSRSRYSICYENVRDLSGYITEKIFDSFFSGCVPVYWGASNISEHIPIVCFIDRRNFKSNKSLYDHLNSINEDDYRKYQIHIIEFLKSENAKKFSADYFSKKIVSEIATDLNN